MICPSRPGLSSVPITDLGEDAFECLGLEVDSHKHLEGCAAHRRPVA